MVVLEEPKCEMHHKGSLLLVVIGDQVLSTNGIFVFKEMLQCTNVHKSDYSTLML